MVVVDVSKVLVGIKYQINLKMENPLKHWTVDEFDISSYLYGLNERKNKFYEVEDEITKLKCKYDFNELGFRGESINNEGFKIMSLGCSLTEGVGVQNNETWTNRFSKLIPNSVDLNFGAGGRSNDFITRCLLTFFDLIRPDLVIILYTATNRREYYDYKCGVNPFIATHPLGHYFNETKNGREVHEQILMAQTNHENTVNWYKNHLLIKYFLESKKCNWIWDNSFINTDYQDENLFNRGYTNGINTFTDKPNDYLLDRGTDNQHPGKLHQENYAKNLHQFITKNHPEYLKSTKNFKKRNKIL